MKPDSFCWVEDTNDQFSFSLKRKRSFKKLEFVGWGSKPLIEFLQSIGRETGKEYSRHEASSIVNDYVNSNRLINPQKKKRILCDERLRALFGKKSIPRNKVFDLLEKHFIQNRNESDEESSQSEEDKEEDNGSLIISKERKIYEKRKVDEAPKSCYAAINSQNIKAVYLKRSLVQSLLETDKSFEDKVVGSFVRIKSDPNDYFQKNSHQLQQVTGIKRSGDGGMGTYLRLSNWIKDVPISSLSEDSFSEEECEDLRERVKAGLLKRPTVVEFELKAHALHEDITKHWINREITLLQRRIDHANEKGWRRELHEYSLKRQLLMTKAEQDRLLSEKPEIVAEELEPEATPLGASEKDEEKSCSPKPEETRLFIENIEAEAEEPEKETMPLDAPEEVGGGGFDLSVTEPVKKGSEVIELSDDEDGAAANGNLLVIPGPHPDDQDGGNRVVSGGPHLDDANGNRVVSGGPHPDDEIWYYLDPQGVVQGPFPLSSLSRWYKNSYFGSNFCIWRNGQSLQQPVLLLDVLRKFSMI